jgi:hypothetical protein
MRGTLSCVGFLYRWPPAGVFEFLSCASAIPNTATETTVTQQARSRQFNPRAFHLRRYTRFQGVAPSANENRLPLTHLIHCVYRRVRSNAPLPLARAAVRPHRCSLGNSRPLHRRTRQALLPPRLRSARRNGSLPPESQPPCLRPPPRRHRVRQTRRSIYHRPRRPRSSRRRPRHHQFRPRRRQARQNLYAGEPSPRRTEITRPPHKRKIHPHSRQLRRQMGKSPHHLAIPRSPRRALPGQQPLPRRSPVLANHRNSSRTYPRQPRSRIPQAVVSSGRPSPRTSSRTLSSAAH